MVTLLPNMTHPHRPLLTIFTCSLLTCYPVAFLSGCSFGSNVQFDRISSQEDTLQQIQATPTRFSMPIEENQAAWERARFFLERYAGKGKIQSDKQHDRDTMTKMSSSGFRYQFIRQFERGEAHFQVFCTPAKGSANSTADALLNAKNVARFLKDGELEVSRLIGES